MNDLDKVFQILSWTKEYIQLECNPISNVECVYPNSIYMAHLGGGVGCEEHGDHPVLVVDSYKTSSVCIVIPLTSKRLNDSRAYHVDLEFGTSTALVEQIRAISKNRIYSGLRLPNGSFASITENDRQAINEQLAVICQLKK